ncbi:unnamed protein product [Arctia plantaginis]|uniref:C2H2-type domain-containing protein n=1 Tax=Arctia plantaginis TaxID=874455 RepID=A0A8S1A3Q9_ARCPL|nr:unnamed protein product [Arctia plantaginis]
MSDVESSDLSDWDREELSAATKMLTQRWKYINSSENTQCTQNTQCSGEEIVSEIVPEFEVDLQRVLTLKEKILSISPRRWRKLKPEYKLTIQQILWLAKKIESRTLRRWNRRFPEHDWALLPIPELAEEPSSTEEEGTIRKRRVRCYQCLNNFCDKDALEVHLFDVHLRNISICTVEGCIKMFYSAELRNRHSEVHNMSSSV